jgi:phosphoserine phosphatase RsbU/P
MAKHSILVVEDEHTLRRLLEYRLSKQYAVRTAANGEEALERVNETPPDLIISDIMMPKMDGFALQASLQQEKDTRAIPFIFLTAKADDNSRLKGMRTGVDDYITKPFDIEQLLTRIERLLERTKIFQTQLDARIGKDFSQKLLPKKLPNVEGYKTYFHNSPREHGGGDLFDWTEAAPGTFFITIGDVMGKGLQAKFYAFSFLSYVRGTLHAMLRETTSPADLMMRVNQLLMQDEVMDETFASLLLMKWEPAKHQVTYANAGHCRPALITPQGAKMVEYSDIILGLDPHSRFTDTVVDLPEGSALVGYTDGLMEQKLKTGEMVGEEGILQAANSALWDDQPVESMLKDILKRSDAPEFGDDILVFWLQRS